MGMTYHGLVHGAAKGTAHSWAVQTETTETGGRRVTHVALCGSGEAVRMRSALRQGTMGDTACRDCAARVRADRRVED